MQTQDRPVSRRGIKVTSTMSPTEPTRPGTSQRQLRAMRPPSAVSQYSRLETSNRLQTGLVMQPPRTGALMNFGADRPITQQGLSGVRTATARGSNRQVLDKRYYEGLLRQKIKDIFNQITKLKSAIQVQHEEATTCEVYENRVKEIALELTNIQGELSDYNAVIDHGNVGTDASEIKAEAEEIREENRRQTAKLEEFYQQNLNIEHKIQQFELDIENEKNVTQKAIEDMNLDERDKYNQLKNLNENFLAEIRELQQQLDSLSNEKSQLQNKISNFPIKQEAVMLYEKLQEKTQRKESLLAEESTRSTPAQEREQLLAKVKEDNAEMATIDRQIAHLNEQIILKKEALEQIERDLEEGQSERYQKIKDLRKRSDTMEEFLATYEESKNVEIQKIEKLEKKVENILLHMSGNISREEELLSNHPVISSVTDDFENGDLQSIHKKLQDNMKKVDLLKDSIQVELVSLKEKIASMTKEISIFDDLDRLREENRKKRDNLMEKRDVLMSKKPDFEKLQELKERNKTLTKQLEDDETYVQLHNLETKLLLLEQSNESIRTFIEDRKNELHYEDSKISALKFVDKYNTMLIKVTAQNRVN